MLDTLLDSITPSYIPATKPLTKSQTAAVHYLRSFDRQKFDEVPIGWDFLVGICYRATQNLFTIDGHSEYCGPSGFENTTHTRRREFILEWLGEYFKPFRGLSGEALDAAIDTSLDDFRWIGRKCKFAFLDKIRKCPVCAKRKVKQCRDCGCMLSHKQMNTRGLAECPECAAPLKNNHSLVCKEGCQPLSVRTSLDAIYGEDSNSKLSEYVTLVVPETIQAWLRSWKPDLEALGLYTGFSVFVEALLAGSGVKSVTRKWSELEGVSLKVARARKKQFFVALDIVRDHRLVREFYRQIEKVSDGPRIVLAVGESQSTREARLARAQAARDIAAFNRGLSPEAIKEGTEAAVAVADEILSADQDEIKSRKNPEIALATRFRETDAGSEHFRREAELDSILEDCSLEDVAEYIGLALDPEWSEEECRQRVLQNATEFYGYTGTELEPDSATGYDMLEPE
jgi:hypothetical protein